LLQLHTVFLLAPHATEVAANLDQPSGQRPIHNLPFHCAGRKRKEAEAHDARAQDPAEPAPVRLGRELDTLELAAEVAGHEGHGHEDERHLGQEEGDARQAFDRVRLLDGDEVEVHHHHGLLLVEALPDLADGVQADAVAQALEADARRRAQAHAQDLGLVHVRRGHGVDVWRVWCRRARRQDVRVLEGRERHLLLLQDAVYEAFVALVEAVEGGELAAYVVEVLDVGERGSDEHFLSLYGARLARTMGRRGAGYETKGRVRTSLFSSFA
jgi:hypothetical protein